MKNLPRDSMGFTSFQKHCIECEDGKPCGKMHVYALSLNESIADQKWFKLVNPNYRVGSECFYVGRTERHLPKCRASAHQHCKSGSWDGKGYLCYCSGEGKSISCTRGSRGSSKVDRFNTFLLRKKLFRKENPQEDRDSNKRAEQDLADNLRKQGFGVWAGHLDSKGGGMLDDGQPPSEDGSDQAAKYQSMSLAKIKQLLREQGKPISGSKPNLIARLIE